MKWQYSAIITNTGELPKVLAERGEEEWELTAVLPIEVKGYLNLFFKKPQPEQQVESPDERKN